MTKNTNIYLVLILIQVFFGINFISSKIIVSSLDPLIWTCFRFLVSGALLFGYLKYKKIPTPESVKTKDHLQIASLSFLGMGLGQLFIMYSLKFTQAVNVAIITSTIPVWVFVILALSSLEKMHLRKVLGLLICTIGFYYLKDFKNIELKFENLKGDLLALIGVLMIASYISFLKPLAMKFNHFWLSTTGFLWCGIILIPFIFIFGGKIEFENFNLMVLSLNIFFSVFFGTVLTYLLNNWVLKKVTSSFTALFIYLQPVVTAILSYFIYKTEISTRIMITSFVIFIGIIISTRNAPKHP